MKKILLLSSIFIALLGLNTKLNAQAPKSYPPITQKIVSTDTTTNTDTTIVYITDNSLSTGQTSGGLTSIQVTVNWVSGTAGGFVLLQYSNDGVYWQNINTDTLTITSLTAGVTGKLWAFAGGTDAIRYRAWGKTTGTQRSFLSITACRRPEEGRDYD